MLSRQIAFVSVAILVFLTSMAILLILNAQFTTELGHETSSIVCGPLVYSGLEPPNMDRNFSVRMSNVDC